MSKKWVSVLLVIVTAAFLLAGCGKNDSHSAAKEKIVIAQSSDAMYLDPQVIDDGSTNSILCNIYDGLVNRQADLSIVPGLAEKWEQKDDLTWIFYLRKNVVFHNEKAFTADDVVFTIDRLKKQKVVSGFARGIANVRKIDDYTVEIKTPTPYPILPNDLVKVRIINKEYVTQVGNETFNQKPVGTGPYKVTEWIKEDHLTLQANEKYWQGSPQIKTVIFRPISNEATRTAALLSGEVDVIADVPVRDAERIEKDSKLKLVREPSLRLIYLILDIGRDRTPAVDLPKNPFQDERVRQAVRLGIDIDSIIKNVMNGRAYPAEQGNPKEVIGFVSGLQAVKYDPEKAKALLAEAGYPNGFTVTLDAPNNRYPNDSKVAEAIASQWAKIGINVKLNLMPKALYFDYTRLADKTTVSLIGWTSENADAGFWYRAFFYSKDKKPGYGTSNRSFYTNPEFDNYIDQADSTARLNERAQFLQQATRQLQKDLPLLPLYFQENAYGFSKRINFTPRKDEYIYASDIQWSK
ncbi:hypothetical protein AXX12_06585 [Anaerosporomusa subterranea]|uniref:Solute-binding protein family 5 domain-containing protein n=1 Tax=Anaerosporomusa subterranea TaxID=1794912 RepID=A0A154BQH2_ANASB|nr:ABC transporter substrate-binding protein [Anaerosporomusa subterranea]KYZ76105.1 hypothetical protein AXX12_06585 [Anaerosporomusa subterranea]